MVFDETETVPTTLEIEKINPLKESAFTVEGADSSEPIIVRSRLTRYDLALEDYNGLERPVFIEAMATWRRPSQRIERPEYLFVQRKKNNFGFCEISINERN